MADVNIATTSTKRPGFLRLIARGLMLRCPACGQTKVFRGWFAMHEACSHCGRQFQRGPGYFLGSIYVNYAVTGAIVIALFFSFFLTDTLTGTPLLVLLCLFALVFPVWFFRYARALWIAFDELVDPWAAPHDTAQTQVNDPSTP
jgi:uncharacterized protein (DUF983 family)